MPGAALTIVEDDWPILRVRWPSTPIDDEELDRLRDLTARALARREPYAMISDARLAPAPNALQRKRMSEDAQAVEALLSRHMVASAVVVSSPVMRAIVTAVNWLAPPPYPVRIFSDITVAEEWVRERLGLPPYSMAAEG